MARVLMCSLLVLGLLSVLGAASSAEELATNVSDANLGDPNSTLSIRLLEVPYYVGERLVVQATVRNSSSRQMALPLPEVLPVQFIWAPTASMGQFIQETTDRRVGGGSLRYRGKRATGFDPIDEIGIKDLAGRSVAYAPGESRSAVWVAFDIPSDHRDRDDQTYGFVLYSYGVLPARWFRVSLHKFTRMPQGVIRSIPGSNCRAFCFVVEAWPGKFLALRKYWAMRNLPMDVDYLNRVGSLVRFGIVTNNNVTLGFDARGQALIDGLPSSYPQYRFPHGLVDGWALGVVQE